MRRALGLALVLLLTAGCLGPDTQPPADPPADDDPPPGDPAPPDLAQTRFDGSRAYDLVREQVHYPNGSVRHRVPGTPGNTEVAAWIADSMDELGYATSWHHFNATYGCETTPMHNVIAERPGTSDRVVIFAAHYDTRPIAEKDPDPERRDEPIPGANDGGSGVAVLLELARVLPPTSDTVRFVFFDAEDGGGYKGRACTDWILGSRAYAASLAPEEHAAVRAFVLVDLVGDQHLQIPREQYSDDELQEEVYGVARMLGHDEFLDIAGIGVIDDHIPFVERGVPAVNLIHTVPGDPRAFPETHHTHADDMENVSPHSLDVVGSTLEAWAATLG